MDHLHHHHQHKPVHALPKEGELVDFQHGAAGHEGISSSADGDLIIKPCTQAELDFYEAAKAYPDFQALMPVYMGKLEQGAHAEALKAAASATEGETAIPVTPSSADAGGASTGTGPQEQPSETQPGTKQDTKAWVPSGGKKLSTGLAIALENAAASFKKPNVIDLKLGSQLWDDNAPQAKRAKLDQVSASTTSGSLGFRVAGAKVWSPDNTETEVNTDVKDGYRSFNKLYGQSLSVASVKLAIARFLCGTTKPTAPALLGSPEARIVTERLISQVEEIQRVLENQESRMYSASILIVIEGDQQALRAALAEEKKLQEEPTGRKNATGDQADEESDDDESVTGPKVMEVRLIDFAHAQFTPGQGPDENALRGVRNILKILREICE